MSTPIPYMQFYIADYIGDTMHLTTEQHGAYMLILCAYWQSQRPPTETQLPYITRMSVESWDAIRSTMAEFFVVEAGKWHHKRVDEELKKVRTQAKKNRIAGKKSGAVRRANKEANERAFNERSTNAERKTNQTYVRDETAGAAVPMTGLRLSKLEQKLNDARAEVWKLEDDVKRAANLDAGAKP